MIAIQMDTIEQYDSSNNEFTYEDAGVIRFEYSLKALYDWESKWKKPFLKGELTDEELLDFYLTMALDPVEERFIDHKVQMKLAEYIADSHTATTFSTHESNSNKRKFAKGKIHTAEELYALMFSASVPIEFENRNLNRLLVVLRIISSYSQPPKKMSKQDTIRQNAELNRQRREQMKTKG